MWKITNNQKLLEIVEKNPLILNTNSTSINSGDINIKCIIFQEDLLTPLLFCLALILRWKHLNETNCGYKVYEESINHLLYMDDLKPFAKNDNQQLILLQTVKYLGR